MRHFLAKTMLFQGISEQEIVTMLDCLGAERRQYEKGTVIYRAGTVVQSLGLVLSGSVRIEHIDHWGNQSIWGLAEPGSVFAEAYASLPNEPLMVHVVAAEPTEVLFLNVGRMLQTCPDTCAHHSRLIRNLLTILAQKNQHLSRRMFHTSSKSIRGRLLSYLSFQAAQLSAREFDIPFNRQQLAEYLNVDRSALSNELSKMQRDGLLTVHKNHFCLKRGVFEV
ncbi:MAG: Crp/Fnr family transcriptional regulator [Butyricicoccaceae bacterium]